MAFTYKDNNLYVDDVNVADIVNTTDTPVYCYSLRTIINNFNAYKLIPNSLICFAVKSNPNLAILHAIAKLDGGADVVSIGEMKLALSAGIPAKKIVFSGVGKTAIEITFALEQEIHQINAESTDELRVINEMAVKLGKRVSVSVRLNPDIDSKTHQANTTGTKTNKFGIPRNQIEQIRLHEFGNIDFVGLSAHIGSGISSLSIFSRLIDELKSLAAVLRQLGWPIRRLDIGGGLGISYSHRETFPSIHEYANFVQDRVSDSEYEIICEPGRSVVGNSGILVTKVLYTKCNGVVSHVILDAGMNDMIRPAIYGIEHQIIPVKREESATKARVDIVGPICETSDTFARNYEIQELHNGDLLAICDVGAYGISMCSTYNSRLTPPEVIVSGERCSVVRERGNYDAMLSQTKIGDMSLYELC